MKKIKPMVINLFDIIAILLCLTILYAIKNVKILSTISSFVSIAAILILLIIMFQKRIKFDSICIVFLIYFIYNIILLVFGFSSSALYKVFQELILITFSFLLLNIKIPEEKNKQLITFFSKIYYFLFFIIIILIVVVGSDSLFNNYVSGTILKVLFAISYFPFVKSRNKFLFSMLSAIFFFLIGERTPALIFIFIYLIYTLFSLGHGKNKFRLLFLLVIICLFVFVVMYVSLPKTELGILLNQYSRELTGENLFSGRNVIWQQIFDATENNQIFGLTYDNNIQLYYDGFLSTHNLYLWLYLNGGICLLILFIIYLYNIWKKYYISITNCYTKASAAYFLGFLILCNFELLLLINNFSVSMFMWFVISFGINVDNKITNKYKIAKNKEAKYEKS